MIAAISAKAIVAEAEAKMLADARSSAARVRDIVVLLSSDCGQLVACNHYRSFRLEGECSYSTRDYFIR